MILKIKIKINNTIKESLNKIVKNKKNRMMIRKQKEINHKSKLTKNKLKISSL